MSGVFNAIERIHSRLRSIMIRGLVQRVREEGRLQKIQVKIGSDDPADLVDHYQEFGFSSSAPDDSEAVLICRGGDRNNMISICVASSKYRLKLKRGEAGIYNAFGDKISLLEKSISVESQFGHKITITKDGITIDSKKPLTCTGNVTIKGSLSVEGASILKKVSVESLDSKTEVSANGINLSKHVHSVDQQKSITLQPQNPTIGGA